MIRACPAEILILRKSMNITFKSKNLIYLRKRLRTGRGKENSDFLSGALQVPMIVHLFIISANLLAGLETHFDLWEDLLYLSALQEVLNIITP